jgi:hypothetical protein
VPQTQGDFELSTADHAVRALDHAWLEVKSLSLKRPLGFPQPRSELRRSTARPTPAVRVHPGASVIGPSALRFLRAFPLRQSFRRLCVPQITFHSDWQLASPRRWNRSIPRHVLVWPNTGSMI